MNWLRTVRAELRKLTTTKMPLGFLIVLVVIGAATAIAVAVGTDMDGSKTFISTAADQQSLMAFAGNALVVRDLSLDEIGEQAFRAGIALHELSRHTDSLEDRFFAWTGDATGGGTQSNPKEEL